MYLINRKWILDTGYWIVNRQSSIVNRQSERGFQIAIVLQNAGKQGFFVISGRSSRRPATAEAYAEPESEPEPGK